MTKRKLGILLACLFGAFAIAGPVKVWSTGSSVSAADLNANFAHLHDNVGHGHGGRIVDADVASGAAISSAKLAGGAFIPRGVGSFGTATVVCSSNPCASYTASGVSGAVGRTAPGIYVVNIIARPNTVYQVLATVYFSGAASPLCVVDSLNVGYFIIRCRESTTGALTDSSAGFVIFDNDA